MRTAVARNRRTRYALNPGHNRSVYALLAGAAVLLIAASIGLLLMTRSSTSSSAVGSEHSLGVAAAPVVVEEWSDFE